MKRRSLRGRPQRSNGFETRLLRGAFAAALSFGFGCGGNGERNAANSGGSANAGASGAAASGAGFSNGGSGANTSSGGGPGAGSTGVEGKSPCYGGCSDTRPRPVPLPRPMCPEGEPSDGDTCAQEGLRCSYGNSRAAQCRHIYDCKGSAWKLDPTLQQRYSCAPLHDDYCPEAPQHEMPCVVATPGLTCDYGALSCACNARSPAPGKPGTWICFGPPANTDCPAVAPNLGEGCTPNGLACDYDMDGCEAAPSSSLFCFDGAWEQGGGYNCAG